jgi:hypothetical protein
MHTERTSGIRSVTTVRPSPRVVCCRLTLSPTGFDARTSTAGRLETTTSESPASSFGAAH